jgi:hypothetical protein
MSLAYLHSDENAVEHQDNANVACSISAFAGVCHTEQASDLTRSMHFLLAARALIGFVLYGSARGGILPLASRHEAARSTKYEETYATTPGQLKESNVRWQK